ncbi:MAG: T9SS type A sorting domain-containing protein [Candidatus Delongbacteria bacterium]|nr:T9SS type A sorting domain-containing protein [Candidatus Delongbacteria bacterium]MBN2834739.1 T9SS type A sorting domain-containing protein [Candidatus Delongbacteria bacterium]
MRKVLIFLLFSFTLLFSLEVKKSGENYVLSGDFAYELDLSKSGVDECIEIKSDDFIFSDIEGDYKLPYKTYLLALPDAGSLSVGEIGYTQEVVNLESPLYYVPTKNGCLPQSRNHDIVEIGDPIIAGNTRFVQVVLRPMAYNDEKKELKIYNNFNIELKYNETISRNVRTHSTKSRSLLKMMNNQIVGYEDVDKGIESFRGVYAFVYPDNCENYVNYLKEWKESMGYKVLMVKKSVAGNTAIQIKNYLSNIYFNGDYGLDYVILFGDVNGSYTIPSFYVEGYLHPQDVSDHKFTVVDGDDYFSDFLIGRLSFRDLNQLGTMITKIIKYEKEPNSNGWTKKALMMGVNNNEYVSGVQTLRTVKKKLLDFTYTNVDSFFTPENSSPNALRQKINTGYSVLAYRGFGGPAYWSGEWDHMFEINDINSLSNGDMLPFVASIVCGGGNFASNDYSTCFGETWLTAGSVTSFKGGIGFVGPSEHDTKTQFNNCNMSGLFQGFTKENIFKCGEMMTRGKMEMYNNYPDYHNWGNALNSDQFYFYVYNLIGDPALEVHHDYIKQLNLEVIDNPVIGQDDLKVRVTKDGNAVAEAYVSLKDENGLISAFKTGADGVVSIPYTYEQKEYKLCVAMVNSIADEIIFTPNSLNANIICLSQSLFSGEAGSNLSIDLELKNISTNVINDGYADFLSYDGITAESQIVNFGDIDPQETKTISLVIYLPQEWNKEDYASFSLKNESIGLDFSIRLEIISPDLNFEMLILESSQYLISNSDNSFKIRLKNTGSISTGDLDLNLFANSNNVEIIQNCSSIDNIEQSESKNSNDNFIIHLESVWNSEPIGFGLEVKKNNCVTDTLKFTVPAGLIDQNSPTWSTYGYVAIESSDSVDGIVSPVYNWLEISPYASGPGVQMYEVESNVDGRIFHESLPFTFKYYGLDYDAITVCSNGYISMGLTNLIYHRNRTIPSGCGAEAMIAPFWDRYTEGYLYKYYDEENHQFIIEWKNMRSVYNQNQRMYFQLILLDPEFHITPTGDGEMIFMYQEVHNVDAEDNYATVGIENQDQNEGLLLSYSKLYPETMHEIQNESAILITTRNLELVGSDDTIASSFELLNNYPNPFNPETVIRFNSEDFENIEFKVYNSNGQMMFRREIVGVRRGYNSFVFNAENLNSGVYFYTISSGKKSNNGKMLLIK